MDLERIQKSVAVKNWNLEQIFFGDLFYIQEIHLAQFEILNSPFHFK
jgi:hypothetical protein